MNTIYWTYEDRTPARFNICINNVAIMRNRLDLANPTPNVTWHNYSFTLKNYFGESLTQIPPAGSAMAGTREGSLARLGVPYRVTATDTATSPFGANQLVLPAAPANYINVMREGTMYERLTINESYEAYFGYQDAENSEEVQVYLGVIQIQPGLDNAFPTRSGIKELRTRRTTDQKSRGARSNY